MMIRCGRCALNGNGCLLQDRWELWDVSLDPMFCICQKTSVNRSAWNTMSALVVPSVYNQDVSVHQATA